MKINVTPLEEYIERLQAALAEAKRIIESSSAIAKYKRAAYIERIESIEKGEETK